MTDVIRHVTHTDHRDSLIYVELYDTRSFCSAINKVNMVIDMDPDEFESESWFRTYNVLTLAVL